MSRRCFVSLQLCLLSLVLVLAWAMPEVLGSGRRGPCTRPLRFGFVCQTDKAFFAVGETARVQMAQFNFTGSDVFGLATGPGLGCDYGVLVRDESGSRVWIPGGVDPMGNYVPAICGAAIFNVNLLDGCILSRSVDVPLIYQNPFGAGVNGAPLPPGFYRIEVFMTLSGPHRTPPPLEGPARGYSPLAAIPIQIE
jgi:hypothetical protein